MFVAALACREVHEVPGEERIGQGDIGVNTGGGKSVAVQVNALFEVTAFGKRPIARDRFITNIGEEKQIAMPIM